MKFAVFAGAGAVATALFGEFVLGTPWWLAPLWMSVCMWLVLEVYVRVGGGSR